MVGLKKVQYPNRRGTRGVYHSTEIHGPLVCQCFVQIIITLRDIGTYLVIAPTLRSYECLVLFFRACVGYFPF